MRTLVAALAACTLPMLGACGDTVVSPTKAAEHRYDGPLDVPARDVLECASAGAGGRVPTGEYAEGATADSPEEALETARHEGGFEGAQSGLAVARREKDRVLYVIEVRGAYKQAVIVHDGPASKGAGGRGWYVESW